MQTAEMVAAYQQTQPAQEWMSRICGQHELFSGSSDHIEFRHDAIRFPGMGTVIGRIKYGADVCISVQRAMKFDSFSLSLPLAGRQILRRRGENYRSDERRGIIVAPDADQELDLDGSCEKLQVVIKREAIQNVAEGLLNTRLNRPFQFEPSMDIGRRLVAAWWSMIRQTLDDWNRIAALCKIPAIAADLEQMLIKGALLAQPNDYSHALDPKVCADCPDFVWRVERFLVERAREEISSRAIEAVAGVSRQKLYEAFHLHRGCTPLAFLKRRRLEGARKMILDRPRCGMTISSIALTWGFNHFGRFAREYAEAFGELPSETAQGARAN